MTGRRVRRTGLPGRETGTSSASAPIGRAVHQRRSLGTGCGWDRHFFSQVCQQTGAAPVELSDPAIRGKGRQLFSDHAKAFFQSYFTIRRSEELKKAGGGYGFSGAPGKQMRPMYHLPAAAIAVGLAITHENTWFFLSSLRVLSSPLCTAVLQAPTAVLSQRPGNCRDICYYQIDYTILFNREN